jgi:hypothetical protein
VGTLGPQVTPAEREALSLRVGFAVSQDDREALEELAQACERWRGHFVGMTVERDNAKALGEERAQIAIDLLVRMQRAIADSTLPPCSAPGCSAFGYGWVPLCKPHIVEIVEGPSGPARTWSLLGIHPTRVSRG